MTDPHELTDQDIDEAFEIPPPKEDRLVRARAYLDAQLGRLRAALVEARAELSNLSGHQTKAKYTAKVRNVLHTPQYETAAKRALRGIAARQDLAPSGAALAARGITDADRRRARILTEDGGLAIARVDQDMMNDFAQEKGRVMSVFSQEWLVTLMDVGRAGQHLVTYLKEKEAAYDWLRYITGGQQIAEDGRNLDRLCDQLLLALGGKLFSLKDKVFAEVTFRYDGTLAADEDECDRLNEPAFDAAMAELAALETRVEELRPHYAEFGTVIKRVGEHVTAMVDEEGWKAYAQGHIKPDGWDVVIDGADVLLEGLAGAIRAIPYPGVGAAAAAVQGVFGRLARTLHKLARDARIADEQKKVANNPSPKVNADIRRRVYLEALDRDSTLMARRVFQIQRENLEDVWTVVGVGLAEIPIPGVGVAIRTFCSGVSEGYYRGRVELLEQELKKQAGERSEPAEILKEWLVEPTEEAYKEAVRTQFATQVADAAARIAAGAGAMLQTLVDWIKEKFADLRTIATDVLKDGAIVLLSALLAKVAAKFLVHLGAVTMAQQIKSGDLREIIDDMKTSSQAVDDALALL